MFCRVGRLAAREARAERREGIGVRDPMLVEEGDRPAADLLFVLYRATKHRIRLERRRDALAEHQLFGGDQEHEVVRPRGPDPLADPNDRLEVDPISLDEARIFEVHPLGSKDGG
jgi:hypothetical protein